MPGHAHADAASGGRDHLTCVNDPPCSRSRHKIVGRGLGTHRRSRELGLVLQKLVLCKRHADLLCVPRKILLVALSLIAGENPDMSMRDFVADYLG